MLVSPGPQPKTGLQKTVTIESGHDVMFFNTDLGSKLEKKSLSLVLAYNGIHHFTPTRLCTMEELNDFAVQELKALCSAALDKAGEINVDTFTDIQKDLLLKVVASMDDATKGLPTLGAKAKSGSAARKSVKGLPFISPPRVTRSTSRSPTVTDEASVPPPESHISVSSSESSPPPPDVDVISVSSSAAEKSATETSESDIELDPRKLYCNQDPCTNRGFSRKKTFDQHVRNFHLGIYNYHCQQCPYKVDSKSIYKTHLKRMHQISEEGIEFKCDVCLKIFGGQNLLSKHKLLQSCSAPGEKKCIKNFHCSKCTRKYMTSGALLIHMKVRHSGKKLRHKCQQCKKRFGDRSSLLAHIKVHANARYLANIRMKREKGIPLKSKSTSTVRPPTTSSSSSSWTSSPSSSQDSQFTAPDPPTGSKSPFSTPTRPPKKFTTKKPQQKHRLTIRFLFVYVVCVIRHRFALSDNSSLL